MPHCWVFWTRREPSVKPHKSLYTSCMDPYGTPNYQILWALREIDKRDRSADVRVPLLDLLSPPLFNELCFERWDLMGLRWFRV